MKCQTNSDTIRDALSDFGTAYYFSMRIRILNAMQLIKVVKKNQVRNGLLLELIFGYLQVAASEFALNLYDAIQLLKNLDHNYEYKNGSAIAHVLRFRHNVVAHRASNWNTDSSNRAHASLDEDVYSIFNYSFIAMQEFCDALKSRRISYGPRKNYPTTKCIRETDLAHLLASVPHSSLSVQIPSDTELRKFFGGVASD